MKLIAREHCIQFPRRPLLMGIVNVNDDSFSGDGTLDVEAALQQAAQMVGEGADIIDVGGESARTNRPAVTETEELRRILPFIEQFRERMAGQTPRDPEQLFPPMLSINTWRPGVAGPALAAGGDLLNDLSGLPSDTNACLCAETGAALLIMHSVGEPKIPHTHVQYQSLFEAMNCFFQEKILMATSAGLKLDSILLDPGIDFAKQKDDNLKILAAGGWINRFKRPVLWPISRKTVVGEVLGIQSPQERDAGTLSCLVAVIKHSASILRVHNVRAAYAANCAVRPIITQ